MLWIEFGKSCKCGDKSNYLTPAAAGTVGGNIPGVESAPCGFVNPRSVALKPTKKLWRPHFRFTNPKQCHFKSTLSSFANPKQYHFEAT